MNFYCHKSLVNFMISLCIYILSNCTNIHWDWTVWKPYFTFKLKKLVFNLWCCVLLSSINCFKKKKKKLLSQIRSPHFYYLIFLYILQSTVLRWSSKHCNNSGHHSSNISSMSTVRPLDETVTTWIKSRRRSVCLLNSFKQDC